MSSLPIFDGTQPITLWHHQTNTVTPIISALIRRFRHRLYSQVVDTAVPVNFSHWYFSTAIPPLPGDEIQEANGTVWTIHEVNHSPLPAVWQAVCETFASAKTTETVVHLRQGAALASLPVRVGPMTTTLEPEESQRLTFYVCPSIDSDPIIAEPNDTLQRSDGTLWSIVRVEKPMYRRRWTAVVTRRG
jgi:hypothetical protein